MRSRSMPHRGSGARARSRPEARIVTLPPPDPWTDRDFAFHAHESLRRRAYVPSAEVKLERDAGERDSGGATRGWKAVGRVAHRPEAMLPETPEAREPDRGHADTSLRDEVAHRIVSQPETPAWTSRWPCGTGSSRWRGRCPSG